MLSAAMQDSPAATLGASFTLQYEEQLKIERSACVLHALTDRECAHQEDVLYHIKLCQNLIDLPKTEQKKRQYEDELEDLMHCVLQRPRFRVLVSEFEVGASVITQNFSDSGTSECVMSDTASSTSPQE